LAAEIKKATGLEAELIGGAGGVFDVTADGELIYSRHQTGLFPKPGDIIAALNE
jgi:predicted Rdx family selenoprotein